MAEEAHYSSGTDSLINKRKYEDQTPPPSSTRRSTGFSAPIVAPSPDSAAPPPASYNSVPPPVAEFELAKQKAKEIAARLLNQAAAGDAKRPRVENGGGGFDSNDKGFSSAPSDVKPYLSHSASSTIPVSYGFQGASKKIDIPNGRVGVIIGKGGDTIKYLQVQSGAKIQVTRDMDADPNSMTRQVELMGNPDQITKAEQLINDVLAEAEAGGSGTISKRVTGQDGSEQFVMKIPNNKVGLVIGKGGEMIKSMQVRSGARIQVIPLHLPPGDTSTERTLQIDGTSEQIESAKQLVNEVISENRRNPSMGGGYQQQGYQARAPTSWGPPGAPPMQQPGYGYVQPGAYPGPSPQYNTSQPPYAGYPQQTSSGYPSNWDQSTVPPTQQTTPGSGYDYYGQQPPAQQQQTPGGPAAPADGTGYNYNQQGQSYNQQGQTYSQDGYGGYHAQPHSGYGQPQYDQQQGYNTATGYGNMTNPPQDPSYGAQADSAQAPPQGQPSAMGQQGYNTTQGSVQTGYGMPPTSQTGYGSQPAAQSGYGPGYGPPQTQNPQGNPPVYGQTQQSPSNAGSYGQSAAVQPGYSHSQPPQSGYAQPDSGSNRTPPSSFGAAAAAAQPGYGAPPYGAPVSQPGYGQAPPPYNSSYGSGYSQPPPVYPADGAAPASQGGVAKVSPQS